MSKGELDSEERERDFNEFLVEEYLKHGSVDEVLRIHRYDIPISYAGYQRVLDRWGIVKAAGPNSKLTEVINFLTRMIEEEIPLEKLYKKMPSSFRVSTATLYRILSYIREGITRRVGTGLVITSNGDRKRILVGKDISTPRLDLGKPYGSISIPMGFSRKRDPRKDAILRVLQQEVFTKLAVKNNMPNVVPDRPKPFMYLDIADVRVEIFRIELPSKLFSLRYFSSFKLRDYEYLPLGEIIAGDGARVNLRVGVKEVAMGYQKYLGISDRNLAVNPLFFKSELNYQLAETSSGY